MYMKKMIVILFAVWQISYLFLVQLPKQLAVHAGTLTSAKDTLSNSRLSFRSKVSAGASGANTFTITSGQSDSTTVNLFPRDTICFGDSLTAPNGCVGTTNYTVSSIPTYNGTTVNLTTALGSTMDGDPVIASQSATHTVVFTTATTVNNPYIQVLIPAVGSGATSHDGFPDYGTSATAGTSGFDAGAMGNSDVICSGTGPTWTPYFVNSQTAGGNYHIAKCSGSGTLASGTTVTITIGGTNKLINPAPVTSGHTTGAADIYAETVNECTDAYTNNTCSNIVDSATIATAPVEGVLVSATVQNYLTFSIAGVLSSTSVCGKTTSQTTTATTVPYGAVTSGTFYTLAQLLTVNTNAANGYVVTAQENGALSIGGLGTTNLANTTCPDNSCSVTTPADWRTYTASGFGYSLANSSGTDASFTYNNGASMTFQAKPFDSTTAQIIMRNIAPVSGSATNVCYGLAVSNVQQAGYYMNKLTYIATPTF